jgi:hypothetical protein
MTRCPGISVYVQALTSEPYMWIIERFSIILLLRNYASYKECEGSSVLFMFGIRYIFVPLMFPFFNTL